MIMATRATEKAESSDLISRLPDELLTHILSFVPSKSSVRTCVLLSKRWSRLWISVPNIDFFELSDSVSEFMDFVDRFLSLNRVMSVRTIQFDVRVEDENEVSRVNAWLTAISERDAEEVRLCFNYPIYRIPDKFFIQNNLVILLVSYVVLKVPQLVCFPNLKTMDLEWIRFFDDNSLKNLLSGSPVIENLDIDLDYRNASHTLYICSSSLRNFVLNMSELGEDDDYKIVIDTPNLRHLVVLGRACLTYNVINVSSLVRANLGFMKEKACLELLAQITHVKTLVLGEDFSRGVSFLYTFQGFNYATLVSLPIFNDLIHLEVKFDWTNNSETLFHLFKCTPNLVTLTLNEACSDDCDRAWSELYEVPQCFLSSIESVEIKGVGDSDEEMRMISYILKNAMVLKKLSLRRSAQCANDLAEENKFLMSLFTLPRSSAACQVEYTLC